MRRTLFTAAGWTTFIFAVYVLLGIHPPQPDTVAEGEVCFKCRRVIDNDRIAAEILDRNLPTKYRTVGCMAAYVAQHPSQVSRYYVTDFASRGLIDASRAHFVPVVVNDLTGERDYRAYYSRGMADSAAQSLGVTVLDWDTVIRRARS
jgi:hypothetical protein